eukprot:jgi/Psemu1/18952/gm1.18952_g
MMSKQTLFFFALFVSLVAGFAPRQTNLAPKKITASTTGLNAAPTMSAIDYVGYAAGQTDEWKGTGVWSGLSVKRDDGDEKKKDDEPKKAPADSK